MNKKQKKGISTVLTTLIIVVASVVLGTAVTLFGTSLFQTGAQSQGVAVTQAHIWFRTDCPPTSTPAEMITLGSVVVRNTGDKLIAIDTIKIRGTIVPNVNWYANTTATASQTQAAMTYTTTDWESNCLALPNPAGGVLIDTAAVNDIALLKQTGPVSLDPGKTAIMYFVGPGSYNLNAADDSLTATDVGAAVLLTVLSGQITQVQSVSVAKV
ncbi:MAG: hypothetical protein ACRENW_07060 [Thermodesulfobacteriota bacterium]